MSPQQLKEEFRSIIQKIVAKYPENLTVTRGETYDFDIKEKTTDRRVLSVSYYKDGFLAMWVEDEKFWLMSDDIYKKTKKTLGLSGMRRVMPVSPSVVSRLTQRR